jgi:hypothetical protein
MKIHVSKKFRPYTIEINSSEDHQTLLRLVNNTIGRYPGTIGEVEARNMKAELIKTQVGSEE